MFECIRLLATMFLTAVVVLGDEKPTHKSTSNKESNSNPLIDTDYLILQILNLIPKKGYDLYSTTKAFHYFQDTIKAHKEEILKIFNQTKDKDDEDLV